jgi:hypothetical protein
VSFMLRHNNWQCDFYSTRRSREWKKNPQIFVISATNAPRFAYRRGECALLRLNAQGSAMDFILCQYNGCYVARSTWPIFPTPFSWVVLNGTGKAANIRWQQIKTAKHWPAYRSEADTQRLALFLTHLSYRWKLPLSQY